MRLAKIMENDVVDCDDSICVSLWFYGCPHRCVGCHNSHLWEPDCMEEIANYNVEKKLDELIPKNGIMRNFSVLGGEPLADYNILDCNAILIHIRENFPNIKIYLWTGYTLEELKKEEKDYILKNVDVLIDGRFELEKRDITLKLRGSSNQRILYKGKDF